MARTVKRLSRCLCMLLMAALLSIDPAVVRAASGGFLSSLLLTAGNTSSSVSTSGYNYALRVSTGSNAGDHIGGFFIRYIDSNGQARSTFLDPHSGILSESTRAANKAEQGRGANRKIEYLNMLGYDIAAFNDQDSMEALTANSSNTFLLHLDNTISKVTEIDILTDIGVNGGTKNWSCASMELFEVTALNGFDMSGYYSKDYNIDFDGRMIARAEPPAGSSSCLIHNTTAGADSCIAVTEKSTGQSLRLVTGAALGEGTSGGVRNVFVELALADVAGGGIDTFVNGVDEKKPLSRLYLPECLILKVNYYDTFNNVRTVSVPVITSALGYAMERGAIDEKTTLAEFLGQGQSLLLSLKLYNFKSFVGEEPDFQLIYDPVNAAARVGFEERTEAESVHRSLANQMIRDQDGISILGMYVYENAREEDFGYELENGCILKPAGDRASRTGGLTKVICASGPEGIQIPVSGSSASRNFTLKPYTQGAGLEPVNTGDRYLVRVRTFPAAEAATTSPVTMKLKYTAEDNSERETELFSLEEAARNYYGSWPASGRKDFAYQYGMSAGETLSCIISVKDVKSFRSATFTLKGTDTWQFEHVDISKIESDGLGSRQVAWVDPGLSVDSLKTDRTVFREIESQPMSMEDVAASFDGTVFLNQNATVKTVDFETQTADVTDDTIEDWRENYYHSMPYEVTQENLGFTLNKISYEVTVVVGSDEVASANGDCGSSNFFYFQLEFENGKSGYVQANQQLASDAFIEGTEASFSISTNCDYGQLTAVHVIPDDSSSDADPYDKLKIDSIRVRRYDTNVDGKLYEWEMTTTEDNCWVGIDYREEAEDASTLTRQTRETEAYKTTYTRFNYRSISQVLVAINTTTYDAGQLTATDMSATFEGIRMDGRPFTLEVGDVLKRMYDFYGEAPRVEDGKTVSDPATMFKVGGWNYFLIGMENVKSINSMTLTYKGKEVGDWKIERVELYRVTRNNGVKIALDNTYCLDGETEQVTQSQNTTPICSEIDTPDLPVTVSVSFQEQTRPLEEASTEEYRVSRTPVSRNDYVNIALYMARNTSDDYSKYKVSGAVRYFSSADVLMESSNIRFEQKNVSGDTIFYANSIGIRDACSVSKLFLQAEASEGAAGLCTVDYAIVQRVRAGVVIETYRFDCNTSLAMVSSSFSPSVGTVTNGEYQMVSLAFGKGTTDMTLKGLTAEIEDVAVAIRYRSSMGDTATVYQSPYVFLTDQQVKNIRANSICHLKFTESYVREITGIVVASTGSTMEAVIESASITTYVADPANPTLESVGRMSFRTDGYGCSGAFYVNGKNTRVKAGTRSFSAKKVSMGAGDALYPISMVFTTGAKQGVELGDLEAANVKIPLEINYRSEDGTDYVRKIDNIKDYLVSGGFGAGETAEIQFMTQDMTNINYMVIRVEDDREDTLLRWDLRQVDFSYGDAAAQKDYSVQAPQDTYVMEYSISSAGTEISYTSGGLKLGVKSAVVVLVATTSNNSGGVSSVTTTSNPAGDIPELILMNAAGTVSIKVDVIGKDVKKSVTVQAGINSPDDCSSYATLNPDTGVITLTVPVDQQATYTVRVISDDNPQAVAVLRVIVPESLASANRQTAASGSSSGGSSSGGSTSGGSSSGGSSSGGSTSGGSTSGGSSSGGSSSGGSTSGGSSSGGSASGGSSSGSSDNTPGGSSGTDSSSGDGAGSSDGSAGDSAGGGDSLSGDSAGEGGSRQN